MGHKGHHRELLPVESVDEVKVCALPSRCLCGGLMEASGQYLRHQVYELPQIKLAVTEYQLAKDRCHCCKRKQVASLPEGVNWGITGVRLTSLMSSLVSEYGLSRPEQQRFLSEYLDFRISLGTVFNKQKLVNNALSEPTNELLTLVKSSEHVHSDETSHHRDGKRQWLWGFVGSEAAYFSVEPSRGKKVLGKFLDDYKGVVISDRYSAYNQFDSEHRQICWAHLKRDFTRLSEKTEAIIKRIGKQLLTCTGLLFELWHRFKSGKIPRAQLLIEAKSVRRDIGELLEQGSYTDPKLRVARFCKNLLNYYSALWNFLELEGIEPTNNTAERALRHSVIWRKKYFCTRSDYGSEFVARSASIYATSKLQGKSNFQWLCQILKNHFAVQYQQSAEIPA